MSILTALAIVIGVIGAVLTYLVLAPLAALNLQIWIIFIGAASFFHCGGGEKGLTASAVANIAGCIFGWIALMIITRVTAGPLGVPVGAAVAVGVMATVLVLAANLPALAAIPSMVYGFASTAGTALLFGADGSALGNLTVVNMSNPLLIAIVSLIVGNIYGYIAQKIAAAITGPATAAA